MDRWLRHYHVTYGGQDDRRETKREAERHAVFLREVSEAGGYRRAYGSAHKGLIVLHSPGGYETRIVITPCDVDHFGR